MDASTAALLALAGCVYATVISSATLNQWDDVYVAGALLLTAVLAYVLTVVARNRLGEGVARGSTVLQCDAQGGCALSKGLLGTPGALAPASTVDPVFTTVAASTAFFTARLRELRQLQLEAVDESADASSTARLREMTRPHLYGMTMAGWAPIAALAAHALVRGRSSLLAMSLTLLCGSFLGTTMQVLIGSEDAYEWVRGDE